MLENNLYLKVIGHCVIHILIDTLLFPLAEPHDNKSVKAFSRLLNVAVKEECSSLFNSET